MRSLEELEIVKDFIIYTNTFENVGEFINLPTDQQITKYVEKMVEGNRNKITGALRNHFQLDGETEQRNYGCYVTTNRMTNLTMKLSEEEMTEYVKRCNFTGNYFLKTDMVELEEDLWVNKAYEDQYKIAIDDGHFHRINEMTYISLEDIFVYSENYRNEHYQLAYDDECWHKIEDLTKVRYYCDYYDAFWETRYIFNEDYLYDNYVIPVERDDGEYINKDVCEYIDESDEWVFDRDYLNDNYDYCNHCETWYPRDGYEHGEYLENYEEWVCEDCIDRNFSNTCDCCGERIYDGDEYYEPSGDEDDDEEQCLCGNCYRNGGQNRIDRSENLHELVGRYHCNHGVWESYKLDSEDKPPFYMGFELEIEPKSNAKYNATESAKIAKEYINCILSEDGSLRTNGFEIVSQPQSYEYLMAQYDKYSKAFDGIVKNGYISHNSRNCGLHFHVTAPQENRTKAVARLWLIIESFKEEFKKLSRRKGNFCYCEFLSDRSSDNSQFRSIYKIAKVSEDAKNETRYLTINDQNDKTVEIRLFKGTLNVNTFFADVQLVKNLFTLAYDIEKPITEIKFKDLIEGEYIHQYCVDNEIYTDKSIIDESDKYDGIEKKILNLTKNILDITWKYIEEQKERYYKPIDKKMINKSDDIFALRRQIMNAGSNVNYGMEFYMALLKEYRNKNVNRIIYHMNEAGMYIGGMQDDSRETIKKKLRKIKEYYNQL